MNVGDLMVTLRRFSDEYIRDVAYRTESLCAKTWAEWYHVRFVLTGKDSNDTLASFMKDREESLKVNNPEHGNRPLSIFMFYHKQLKKEKPIPTTP